MAAPLEYVIIGFAENAFSGEIARELSALIERRTVRIVDLLFVSKGLDGTVATLEVDEHDQLTVFAELDGEVGGVIGADDIEHVAESLDGGASVLLIVWEDLWAEPLANAIERAGGTLIEGARIPRELAAEVEAALAAAS